MLRDVSLRITSGGTPKSSESKYYDGVIPWLNTKEIHFNYIRSTERNITELGLQNSSAKWIPKDSVVVAMYGATAAKVAYSLIDLTTNQACCNIIVDASKADSRYVYYYLQSSYDELSNLACGAAQQNLSIGVISDFPILIPSLDEQKRIAGVLSSLDDKIDLLHRENATLEALAETLFRHYFIENPNPDWKEGKLGDVANVSAGGDKPQKVSNKKTEDTPVPIFSNGIEKNGLYGFTDKARIFEESVTVSARGTIGFVSLRTEPFVPIVRLITLAPIAPMTSKYLYYWAKLADINGTGTTQQQLTVPDFKETKLLLPDTILIQNFTRKANIIHDKIRSNQQQIFTLTAYRDTLLPSLMSGDVKVGE